MESLLIKILSTVGEALVAGAATGGVLAIVWKVQMLLGVKDKVSDVR
jgi:hypothetical protein